MEKQVDDLCDNDEQCIFLELPNEVLLHICSFIDCRTLIESVSVVCKRLNDIISNDSIWLYRLRSLLNRGYPSIASDDAFSWQRACREWEDGVRLWSNDAANMTSFVWLNAHDAAVDGIHLMKNGGICVSGSRDRNLHVWRLLNDDGQCSRDQAMIEKTSVLSAHEGWIWRLASVDDTIYSAGWDGRIKLWKINEAIVGAQQLHCPNAVTSLSVIDAHTVLCGIYGGKVALFDVRLPSPQQQPQQLLRAVHRLSVLCVAATDDGRTAVTGSEDGTLAVWDLRAATDKVVKTFPLVPPSAAAEVEASHNGDTPPPTRAFPMRLTYDGRSLYVGDNKGHVHLFDAQQLRFQHVQTNEMGHSSLTKITGLHANSSLLISSSMDGEIRVSTATQRPHCVATLRLARDGVGDICYQNDILAAAGSDNSVRVWVPRDRFEC